MPHSYLLHHLLEHASSTNPSKEGIVDLVGARRSFNYRSFHAMVSHCAAMLQQQELERRDRVAIYLPKSVEEVAGIFAATMAGGFFVDLNSPLLWHPVAHILTDCGLKYFIPPRRAGEDICH